MKLKNQEIQKLLSIVGDINKLLLFVSILVILVAVLSVLVITYNNIYNRKREIAILRAIGATKRWILYSTLLETIFICFSGWFLGVIMGYLIVAISSPYMYKTSGVCLSLFKFSVNDLLLLPVMIFLGALAGIIPAFKAYKTDVATNLVSKQ